MISYEDFAKIDIKVGRVISGEKIENSDKLLLLKVDLKEEQKQIVSGIAKQYLPEDLIGKQIVIITNLIPRKIMGYESQGMILAADDENGPTIIIPEKEVPPGTNVR